MGVAVAVVVVVVVRIVVCMTVRIAVRVLSMRGRVKGRALLLAVRQTLDAHAARGGGPVGMFDLRLPRAAQGYFLGASGELRPAWAALGLRSAVFDKDTEPHVLLPPLPA